MLYPPHLVVFTLSTSGLSRTADPCSPAGSSCAPLLGYGQTHPSEQNALSANVSALRMDRVEKHTLGNSSDPHTGRVRWRAAWLSTRTRSAAVPCEPPAADGWMQYWSSWSRKWSTRCVGVRNRHLNNYRQHL